MKSAGIDSSREAPGLDYELPEERIALWPAPKRDGSRLLEVERHGTRLGNYRFSDLPRLLRKGDLVVLNDSRVFPARLRGTRAGGRPVEVLLTESLSSTDTSNGGECWAVLARGSGRLRAGEEWSFAAGLRAVVIRRREDERLEVRFDGPTTVLEAAASIGETPLPPYIRRAVEPDVDPHRYQTVYADPVGSCAAPTAGLHFTRELLGRMEKEGVRIARLTLHVGWATFRPLREGDSMPPRLPPEPYVLPETTANAVAAARRRGGRVIAVGTTCARVLEARATDAGEVRGGRGSCGLTITPGHRFRVVDALLTNFHLPRTTLLVLVSAFAGVSTTLAAYRTAVASGYRFYSYGDAMLIQAERGEPDAL
ncbi:MAG: tRNA preQ1(34) S-adenosylmethionine ribosyltransferase-isomerase QueA [Acidobacteria bacterium]|nr:tRNA preQ1(34) S-adenosylmethionine ribosyltransferase-isomerase QueA [Acidobacteriota bacterium]